MQYWFGILDEVFIYAIFAVSLNLLMGYAGQISVAHGAFGAIGGYTAAFLAVNHHVSALPALLIGAAIAFAAGILVSLPALRLSPEYLILLTIAVSSIVLLTVAAVPQLGGSYGLILSAPADFSPLPGGGLLLPRQWLLPLLVASAAVFAVCWRMGESPWGRVLRAIRDDELATLALGKNVAAYKSAVFGITAGMAGVAGALLFFFDQLASPDVYSFNVSLAIFSMVIFGGVGNLVGSVVGALVLILLQPLLEKVVQVDPSKSFLIQLVVYGIGLVLMMRLRPQGVVPEGASLLAAVRARRRLPPAVAREQEPAAVAAVPVPRDAATMPAGTVPALTATAPDDGQPRLADAAGPSVVLEVRGLCKRFGGVIAADALDLDLAVGQITALVGPNGAGKTTVFNLLTGAIGADAGSIRLSGRQLRGKRPDQVARLGMARSFQDVRIFPRLSVLSNVMLAVHHPAVSAWRWPVYARGGEHLADLFLRPRYTARLERRAHAEAMRWLQVTGLDDLAEASAGSLAYGQQKLLSLARLLATGADVMLLDEPTSGVDARWLDTMLELVASLRGHGKAVCVVEHSLHVVEQLADTVCFMELGRITARGPISELTSDPRLAESYFGTV